VKKNAKKLEISLFFVKDHAKRNGIGEEKGEERRGCEMKCVEERSIIRR